MEFRGRDGTRLAHEFKTGGWLIILTVPATLLIAYACLAIEEWQGWASSGSAACAGLGVLTVAGDYFLPPGPGEGIKAPNIWRTAGAGIIGIASIALGIFGGIPSTATN